MRISVEGLTGFLFSLQNFCGVKKGDRVALLFSNTLEFCICYFAIVQIGAVCLPLNYRLSGQEMEYQLKDTEPRVLIFEDIYRETVLPILPALDKLEKMFITGQDIPEGLYGYNELEKGSETHFQEVPIDEEDLASIMYTSGTTGRPKGVMLCHRNLICNGMIAAHIMQVTPKTKQMILTPLFHASALHSQFISSILMVGTSVIMKEFKTKDSLELMARERVTLLIAVPTMYWFWVTYPEIDHYHLASIELTLSGLPQLHGTDQTPGGKIPTFQIYQCRRTDRIDFLHLCLTSKGCLNETRLHRLGHPL